ncbi:MAG: FkbM family methyltransferase [Treponematales bacterium]
MDVLEQNIARINHNQIYIEPKFCLESSNDTQYAVAMERGTAQLVKSGNTGINGDTLDSILMRHETFQKANLLKIDTDGFEIKVLKGAGKLLENGPVIYFEFNPDVYAANGESTFELLDMLVSHGYTKALFYTNFGVPAGICNFSDKHKIQELIDNIDNKTIYYYDILTITDNTYSRYESILKNEMKILEK